jgi:RNA polymerase subunit RPABC4/transcription elongation factor Spt4
MSKKSCTFAAAKVGACQKSGKRVGENFKLQNIMIVDPESELGKSLGITFDSYSKRYICPKCHRPSDTLICPNCGVKCNTILY